MSDLIGTHRHWATQDISIHIVNLFGQSLDLSSPGGRWTVNTLRLSQDWNSAAQSRRVKNGFQQRDRFAPRPGRCGPGRKRIKHRGRSKLELPDKAELAVGRLVVRWRDRRGLAWDAISDKLEHLLAKREGRAAIPRVSFGEKGRKYSRQKCQRLYAAYDKAVNKLVKIRKESLRNAGQS